MDDTTSQVAPTNTSPNYISNNSDTDNSYNNINTKDQLGYQLRALNANISALQENPWLSNPTQTSIHATNLGTDLVHETLNYFVNCGKRLSQMTKTYDDNDAYIMLLQEKEDDLELAARIGQDLLKQNKELKDSIKNLEIELVQRQDDVQQLRHELASKISLLDTFIEEEEHQTSLAEQEDDSTFKQPESVHARSSSTLNNNFIDSRYLSQITQPISEHHDEVTPGGFLSLNYNNQKPTSPLAEPFSSLPYYLNETNGSPSKLAQQLTRDDSSSTISEEHNLCLNKKSSIQKKLVQTVTFQLVESNKRLCELQDELLYKSEQNLLQQEKIYHLQEQVKESERRLDDMASENETLQQSIRNINEIKQEISDELKVCKHNFNELLRVFVELQKETRLDRNRAMHPNSNSTLFGVIEPISDMNNISFDSFVDTHLESSMYYKPCEACNQKVTYGHSSNNNATGCSTEKKSTPVSPSLLDEIKESMHEFKMDLEDQSSDSGRSEYGDATDEGDSGVHTNQVASFVSPDSDGIDTGIECKEIGALLNASEDKRSWLGFSSYMLTTILLICLSVTLNASSGFNLAQKLRIKF